MISARIIRKVLAQIKAEGIECNYMIAAKQLHTSPLEICKILREDVVKNLKALRKKRKETK